MNRIIQGIQSFQRDVYPGQRDLFERLASGQSPEALFIACSDSRVALELLTQSGPGDIFVCRNAGNIAPAYGHNDAVTAAIEYAVSALAVKDIVVKGHSDCGAMKGLLNPASLESAGIDRRSPDALEAVTKLNIRLQLEHLRTHPQVRDAVRTGSLSLHGWYYRIGSGAVEAWDVDGSRWVPVHDAYTPLGAKHEHLVGEALHA
jgi:carbonic anhydrase